MANSDSHFNRLLSYADIIHADGQSVVTMSKWTDGPSIPERSATTDMIHDIPQINAKRVRHFLLGGTEEIVEKCAYNLSQNYSNFKIAGTLHGYFTGVENSEIVNIINESDCDILWVGLGKPKEQKWVVDNKHQLNVPVIITCGGCYNYVTGDYSRAPIWMQKIGLEWFVRVMSEPKKFFWRYLTTNPHSIYCVLKHKIMNNHNAN
jgi:exopolysaccharide biosynthesis WecB/TagA/CpsF family protein